MTDPRRINYRDEHALIIILSAAYQEQLLNKVEEFGNGKDILDISYSYNPHATINNYEAMIIYYDDESDRSED